MIIGALLFYFVRPDALVQAVRELYQGFLIWDKAPAFAYKLSNAMRFMSKFKAKMGNFLQFFNSS
jgi:hypothetical protein